MTARTIPTPRSWLWLCGFVALAVLLVVTFKIVLMLFAGVLFALLLHTASAWIARVLHLRYVLALTIVLLLLLGVTILLIVLAAPTIAEQWSTLWEELPKLIGQLRHKLDRVPGLAAATQPQQADKGGSGKAIDLAGAVVSTLGGSLEILGGMVIAFFIGLYGAAQPAAYRRAALALAPHAQRERVDAALTASARNLTRWLLGRLIAMLFVGVTTTILFEVFKLPLAFGLGVLAGVLTFVEYAGAVVSAIPPILIGFSQSPSIALAIAGLFVVLHIIEGYVLTPLLARATVHLPPGITLATQAILGSLAGALGLTMSTPLLIVAISCAEVIRKQPER